MIELSLSVEGQTGLTWPLWKQWVAMADASGLAALYRSDHFTMPAPPDEDSLECIVALTYLAGHSDRVRFGPLVSPVSFREPVMLAPQALALDDLSGGRLVLGVGAGWMEREHDLFGYDLGDMNARYGRWEDGLEVVTRLLRSDTPVSHEGPYYRLQEALLLPRPQRKGGPPVLVGGSGRKRTLGLVARYADIWNATSTTPEDFAAYSEDLDALLLANGRQPGDVKRTAAALCFAGHTKAALEQRVQRVYTWDPDLAALPLDEVLETLRRDWRAVAGPPDVVAGQIRAFAAAGVEELVLQWFDVNDVRAAQALVEEVLTLL